MPTLNNLRKLGASRTAGLMLLVVVIIIGFWWLWPGRAGDEAGRTGSSNIPDGQSASQFNKAKYSLSQSGSIWVIVNKGRILPEAYEPKDLTVPAVELAAARSAENMQLRRAPAEALESLFTAAKKKGHRLKLSSGYRSFGTQNAIYTDYVRQHGQASADRFSARAGHSEHQTGLAADVEPSDGRCQFDACFGKTDEGRFVARNAYRFGFIIRYQKDQEALTGYMYEPWHLRYVGAELAAELQGNGQTLEQFFSLATHRNYPAKILKLK